MNLSLQVLFVIHKRSTKHQMCIQSNPPRSLFRCRYWTGPKDILDGVPIEITNASFLPGYGKFPTKNEQFSISTYDWTKLALAPSHSQQGSTMAFWDPKPILKNVSLKTPNRASSIIYPSCMQQSIRWTANDQTHHTTAKQPLSRIHHCQSFFRRRNSAAFATGPAGRLEHRRDVILQQIAPAEKDNQWLLEEENLGYFQSVTIHRQNLVAMKMTHCNDLQKSATEKASSSFMVEQCSSSGIPRWTCKFSKSYQDSGFHTTILVRAEQPCPCIVHLSKNT